MKELEDFNWFPALLRNFQTQYIGYVVKRFAIYRAFEDYLKTLSIPATSLIDLCSGSGEPAISIFKNSNCFSQLLLTDKYPVLKVISDNLISYEGKSKDVLQMEFEPNRVYSMFNAFHHFQDDDKLMITQKIQDSGSKGFIVEILEPTVVCFLKVLFTTTIGTLILSPLIQPFSLKRLFFTFIVPINVITITYDGLVSVLKSRSLIQYQKLFKNQHNSVQLLKLKNGLSPLIVIQITPKL